MGVSKAASRVVDLGVSKVDLTESSMAARKANRLVDMRAIHSVVHLVRRKACPRVESKAGLKALW